MHRPGPQAAGARSRRPRPRHRAHRRLPSFFCLLAGLSAGLVAGPAAGLAADEPTPPASPEPPPGDAPELIEPGKIIERAILMGAAGGPAATAGEAAEDRSAEAGELTVALLEARRDAAQRDTFLEEEVRTKVVDLYSQAIQELTNAQQSAAQASGFTDDLVNLPLEKEKVEAVLKEVATKAPEPVEKTLPDDLTEETLASELATWKQKLNIALAEEADTHLRLGEVEAAIAQGRSDPEEIQRRLPELRRQLEEVAALRALPADAGTPFPVAEANAAHLEAKERALRAEIEKLTRQSLTADVRSALNLAKRDLAEYDAARWKAEVASLQEVVAELERRGAEAARAEAAQLAEAARGKHPAVEFLSAGNLELTRRAERLLADRARADATLVRLDEDLGLLQRGFKEARAKLKHAVTNETVGQLLRRERKRLATYLAWERHAARDRAAMGSVALQQLEVQKEQGQLSLQADRDATLRRLLTTAGIDPGAAADLATVRAEVDTLVAKRVELLRALNQDYGHYYSVLGKLGERRKQLAETAGEFAGFIDRNLIWIPSAPPVDRRFFEGLGVAWEELAKPARWSAVRRDVFAQVRFHAASTTIALALFLLLLFSRPWLVRHLERVAARCRDGCGGAFELTLRAFLVTGLLAATWPLLPGYLAYVILPQLDARGLEGTTAAFGEALRFGAAYAFLFSFIGHLCRVNGLATVHFQWPAATAEGIRRCSLWLLAVALPATFLFALVEAIDASLAPEGAVDLIAISLTRLLFVVSMLAHLLVVHDILAPRGGFLAPAYDARPTAWPSRLRYLWYLAGTGLLLLLIVLPGFGYDYTAHQIGLRLEGMLWLGVGFTIAYNLVRRWLLDHTERKRRAAAEKQREAGFTVAPVVGPAGLERRFQRLLSNLVSFAFLILLWAAWRDVLPALGILDTFELPWKKRTVVAGESVVAWVTLKDLAFCLYLAAATVIAGRCLPNLVELAVLERLPLTSGSRYAITTISRYLITLAGVVAVLPAIGLAWSQVQWLVAGMGVGLGFGLQEVFANFVSGLILLTERPIRVGDTVTIDGVVGVVTRIRIRATTIIDRDRRELVVPNKTFITGQLINWSLTDPITRVKIPVGVAYGSDTELVQRVILEVAERTPLVLKEPPPKVRFRAFGESDVQLELRVFVGDYHHRQKVRHLLVLGIDEAFRLHGITIPFPQREILLRQAGADEGDKEDGGRPANAPTAPPRKPHSRFPFSRERDRPDDLPEARSENEGAGAFDDMDVDVDGP